MSDHILHWQFYDETIVVQMYYSVSLLNTFDLVFSMKSFAGAVMSFVTVIPPVPPPTLEVKSAAVLPNGHLMTPHDQRRRAALLADSPELSTRPPLNAGNRGTSVTKRSKRFYFFNS